MGTGCGIAGSRDVGFSGRGEGFSRQRDAGPSTIRISLCKVVSVVGHEDGSEMHPVVLLVDDDDAGLRGLASGLIRRTEEFELLLAHDAATARELAAEHRPHVVVLDLSLDDAKGPESGLALMSELVSVDPCCRVIVLTGHDSDQWGVRALEHGAASFLPKPGDTDHILALVRDGVGYSSLKRTCYRLQAGSESPSVVAGLSSRSKSMEPVIESIAFAARTSQPVLLVGETGTGKGVVAQIIHRTGNRARGPFIRFLPTFSSGDLVSSELFGHLKGAFTGAIENRIGLIEEANRGTLFIDEIDELPHETQVSLLNVLQEQTFRKLGSSKEQRSDFRLISATNRSLDEIHRTKRLRPDLFHRIAHLTITLPPLRDRVSDIPSLATQFITAVANRERLPVHGLHPDATEKLLRHHWPGNVRELQAVVEQGAFRAHWANRHAIAPEDLPLESSDQSVRPRAALGSFRERIQKFEEELVIEAMGRSGNNQSEAARLLQLDRTSLRRILKRAGRSADAG